MSGIPRSCSYFVYFLLVATLVSTQSNTTTFQKVCSGGQLPPNAVVAGDYGSLWSPSGSPQYLCNPQGTPFFGHMATPNDTTVPYPGYCFYYNGSAIRAPIYPSSTVCSLVATSTTPITWMAAAKGFPFIPNMVELNGVVAARTAIHSSNVGNRVPGYVSTTNGGALVGSLIVDDFGFMSLDVYEVALTTLPEQYAPVPLPNRTSSVRVVLAIATLESIDVNVSACSYYSYQMGHVTPWCRVPTPTFSLTVYLEVNGAPGGKVLSINPSMATSSELTVAIIGNVSNPSSVMIPSEQTPPGKTSLRLANFLKNASHIGLQCGGIEIVPELVAYETVSNYNVSSSWCHSALTVTYNGGMFLQNISTLATPNVSSTVYVIGDLTSDLPTFTYVIVDNNFS